MAGAGVAVFGLLVGFARHCVGESLVPRLPSRGRWPLAVLAAAVLLPPLSELPSTWRGILLGLLVLGLLRLGRPAGRTAPRQVEPPNSHFNPPGVSHGAVVTPWDSIDLDALHEANRPAVATLLAAARALGPDRLGPAERELLDRMASAARLSAEFRR
jgi:hypothetical protein